MIEYTFLMRIGGRLRQLRNERALTQEDLAAKAGVSLATVQRAERGEPLSADSVASLAAALGLAATELTMPQAAPSGVPYLPLQRIETARQLLRIVSLGTRLDLDFVSLENLAQAELVERLQQWSENLQRSGLPRGAIAKHTLELEAATLLRSFREARITVAGGTYTVTVHEVDDDPTASIQILFAKWDEPCTVLRIGTGAAWVDRAYVLEKLGKWECPAGDELVHPPPDDLG